MIIDNKAFYKCQSNKKILSTYRNIFDYFPLTLKILILLKRKIILDKDYDYFILSFVKIFNITSIMNKRGQYEGFLALPSLTST